MEAYFLCHTGRYETAKAEAFPIAKLSSLPTNSMSVQKKKQKQNEQSIFFFKAEVDKKNKNLPVEIAVIESP